jgi:protein tyrosine/serine phosphatase
MDDGHKPVYLNLPVEYYYPHVSDMIRRAKNRAEVYCIILDHYPDAITEVMRAIVAAREGGIVIHCHSGTDRTGIITALLLSLAGVPVEVIADDYAESQVRLQPLYESMTADREDQDEGDLWGQPTATADMMEIMLAHLDGKYGGVQGYLHWAGLSSSEISQLKKRICDS